jgi:Sulfotransferase family
VITSIGTSLPCGAMTAYPETAAAPPAGKARMPDFFIVGQAKSGTTALWETLRRHPQVFMPPGKEPWFFARNNPQPPDSTERLLTHTGKRVETVEEYLSLFSEARDDQLIGEGSTAYLWSPVAARAIAAAQPSARIIAIFREPAAFLRSLHLQLLANHTETERDLLGAVALDDVRREGNQIPKYAFWPQAIIYSDRVRYAEQLRRYYDVFPREQILVLIYDDFRDDNQGTLRRLISFLDVDESYPLEVEHVNLTNRRVRSVPIYNLSRVLKQGKGPVSGRLKALGKRLMSDEVRKSLLWPIHGRIMYGKPDPPDERVMLELRRRFKPEVVAFGELLDRDLVSLWGYDRLG